MHLYLISKIPSESTTMEEEEVCKMLRECLDLRKKYVYREKVSPWNVEHVAKYTSSENYDPFHFEPVEATAVSLLFRFSDIMDPS